MRHRLRWFIAVPLALAVLAFGGTWVYLNLVKADAPAPLSLSSAGSATPSAPAGQGAAPAASAPAEGRWTATAESVVGYRVDEVLFGQSATAVGRTNDLTGSLTIAGSAVTQTELTVDMTTVESDESRRDGQFRGRIMAVEEFPTSTFTLTTPIQLGARPADGTTVTARATGDLTLRGETKSVTFEVKATKTGARLEVQGSIHLVLDEWGIPSPSFGPATVEDEGELEFLLVLAK